MTTRPHSFRKVLVATLLSIFVLACGDGNSRESAPANDSNRSIPAFDLSKKWSKTQPNINLHHIFLGEINRSGKPVGFHSRPGGHDPKTARVARVQNGPNRVGVYTAQVEIYDNDTRQWKQKFSSLFPDALNHQEIMDIILHAYTNSDNPKAQPWSGPSGLGFEIQGYTNSRGSINTAFPIFVRN